MHFQFSLPSLLLLLVSSCSPIHGRNSHITDNKVYVMNREQVVNDFTKPAQEDQHHDHLQFYKGIEREMKPINTLRILKGMENNVSRQDRKDDKGSPRESTAPTTPPVTSITAELSPMQNTVATPLSSPIVKTTMNSPTATKSPSPSKTPAASYISLSSDLSSRSPTPSHLISEPPSSSPSGNSAVIASHPPSRPQELDTSTSIISAREQTQTVKIPRFEVHINMNSTAIDKNIFLFVTGHHMTDIFRTETPKEISFELLSLSYAQSRNLQKNIGAHETILYFNGDASFTSDKEVEIDFVKNLTKFSFVGNNLDSYMNLLQTSGVQLVDLPFASITEENQIKNEDNNIITMISKNSESTNSGQTGMIISVSVCGTIIVFLSSIILYRSRKKWSNKPSDASHSNPDLPMKVIKYPKRNENEASWKSKFYGFNKPNTMELDEVSAISMDSSFTSTVSAGAWGTANIPLGNTEDSEVSDEEELDLALQPGKSLFKGKFSDINQSF